MPSLQPYHTFKLDSQCEQLCYFSSASEFFDFYRSDTPSWLLGGGSNTLFLKDYEGQVLINRILGIEMTQTADMYEVRVGAGENWHDFVTHCLQNGWYGLENLALIPGCVGAAPIQNIGAYGLEVEQFIKQVECVTLDEKMPITLDHKACQFGYRDSVFKHALADRVVITHVTFALPKRNQLITTYGELAALTSPTPHAIFETVINIRQAKLPDVRELGNAGSFFKNPIIAKSHYEALKARFPDIPGYSLTEHVKVPAAWLLDTLGFKGKVVNKVRCHPTQPLVLTNLGGASGDDVITLAKQMIAHVSTTFSIQLEPEVRLVGRHGLISL